MQDARGTFQSESFYKMITIAMITFLLSLNGRYLRKRDTMSHAFADLKVVP